MGVAFVGVFINKGNSSDNRKQIIFKTLYYSIEFYSVFMLSIYKSFKGRMVKLKLMVLDKNKKLGEDNSKSSFKHIFKKLEEEVDELKCEIDKEDKVRMTEEILDVVQVCIAILFKLFMSGINIETAVQKHNKKLVNRNWKPRAIIKISINR